MKLTFLDKHTFKSMAEEIYFLVGGGGKVTFPDFFSAWFYVFFSVEISILIDLKQISVVSKKWQVKKQTNKQTNRKGPLLIFILCPLPFFNFPPSLLHFFLFFSIFSFFFLASLFLLSHHKFPGEVSGGTEVPPPDTTEYTLIDIKDNFLNPNDYKSSFALVRP